MNAQTYYLLPSDQRSEIEASYMDHMKVESLDLEKPYIFSGLLIFAEAYLHTEDNFTLSPTDIMLLMHPSIALDLMADGVIGAVCEELLIVYEKDARPTEELLKLEFDFKITELEYSPGPDNIEMIRIVYDGKEYIYSSSERLLR